MSSCLATIFVLDKYWSRLKSGLGSLWRKTHVLWEWPRWKRVLNPRAPRWSNCNSRSPTIRYVEMRKAKQRVFDEDGNYKPLLINVTHDTKYVAEPSNDICILGKWKSNIEIRQGRSLEQSEEFLGGKNKEMFLSFMRGMLQWRPEDRKTAKELIEDPWLNS